MSEPSNLITVDDESILARKAIVVKDFKVLKVKTLKAYERVVAAGSAASVTDMAAVLSGMLVGWTEADIDELTIDEMILVVQQIGRGTGEAVPNTNGSPSQPPKVARGRAQTGKKP